MVIIVNSTGDVVKNIPENVYQGSNNANSIVVLAPFASSSELTIAYRLPNGFLTTPALMTSYEDVPSEYDLNGWYIDIDESLTEYYGNVDFQVSATSSTGVIITSFAFNFTVQRGVAPILPAEPTETIYEQILVALASIEADIVNGWVESKSLLPYDENFTYSLNSVLYYNNALYKSLIPDNIGNPLSDTSSWQEILLATEQEVANLIEAHNTSSTAHSDIREELSEVKALAEGFGIAITFDSNAQISSWIAGTYERPDGIVVADLVMSQVIYNRTATEDDYRVTSLPVTQISDLGILPTEKIDLTDYQTKIDNNLETTSKEVVGAINEVNDDKVDKIYSTDYAYTEGLVFTWDTDHYIVGDNTSNLRNAYPVGTETEFVIPKYYDDGTHGTALVTEIGQYAFRVYSLIVDISIPDSITSIGGAAFYNCDNLAKVVMPDSVITIGQLAFASCNNLTNIVISNSVTSIENNAFEDCDSLTSIVIPNSVTSIGAYAFRYCNNLANVVIPNSVTSIGESAFTNCAFSSVTLPSSITSLGFTAFAPNANLTKAYIYAITPPATNGLMFPNVSGILEAIYVPYESLEAYKTATDWSTYVSRIYPLPDGKDLTNKLALKLDISLKGANNGLAELDAIGKVPTAQLPSYVDDVIEVANFASLPVTGEDGKIYITLDTNLTYRWGGSAYVEISPSLALGETSSTAYRGDRGKTAYDHSQLTSGNPHNVTKTDLGLSNAYNPTAYGGVSYGGGADESGISFTDLNSLVYTGFYTCFGTTANVPSASYSWFIQHINSNVGNVSATQIAIAYGTTTIIYKRNKTTSTWGAWENISPSLKENIINKVTSISSSSTDTQYPTAKCMYDIIGNIETLLAEV